ncbi:MAG: 6-hydroxycyclohex-1-ene-1-carbonyl-CoA dehydrogenase [Gammaproteobacteria bacterium]|nr:6-hydroxycyclohex-1-ene-1-carbonyl-CoA dehydrogenase [Gammaproteobacteria bacterium]MDH4254243.1 6-hydroxycyclohex-1-ene-1-carbonyl-CoA dehydrogenase [Gammaproteobacteria bacterium]MDH5310625.1 6-hydroxycyclohex-1-ene-1-carbonyl-CoA dehydrogenase [Gammaproteobacteria bacterium]
MTEPGAPLSAADFAASPGDGEVVVAVAGCGVCHTDLGFYYDGVRTQHPLPLCLGHEISGRVLLAGAGAESWIGREVIVPAVIPCGECDSCRRGKPTICSRQRMPGNDIHGGFATHVVVPARGLCPVDPARLGAAGLELAEVSVVADAVTTPYFAVTQAGVGEGDLVVVNGVGGVGGYCAQVARAFGATVVALDVSDDKLAACQGDPAALALNVSRRDPRELRKEIQAFARENGLNDQSGWFIFECSGTRAGQEAAFGLLNRGATLGVVGFTMEKVEIRLSNLMAFHARALGNWGCPPEFYPQALDLVLDGRIRLAPFVETHPLDQINRVFEAAHGGELKRRAVLVPKH